MNHGNGISSMFSSLRDRIETSVIDDAEAGVFRCWRDIFTDPELFELEMKHIFERNWVYLAHESQVANPNDWFATGIRRMSVIVTRTKAGELGASVDACSHRRALLYRRSGTTGACWLFARWLGLRLSSSAACCRRIAAAAGQVTSSAFSSATERSISRLPRSCF